MLYLSCQLIIISLVIGLSGAMLFTLRWVFQRIRLKAADDYIRYVQLALIFWLFALATLSIEDFFTYFDQSIFNLCFASIPPLALIIYLLFNRTFGRLLKLVPPAWLILIQVFRLLLELTLWLGYKGNFVPFQLTFEWLNQDIIVGLTAVFAATLFFGRQRFLRREAIIWNFFGVLLLFNLASLLLFSFPSAWQVFKTMPDSSFVTSVPFIWIPGFLLPFALAMHLFSLRQMFLLKPKTRKRFMDGLSN
ncbi:MAG: hypothetical protein AAGI49_19380 [Bacteroidota bacterium]